MSKSLVLAGLVFGSLACGWLVAVRDGSVALAQPSRAKKANVNVKAIDQRAERAADSFVRESLGLAREYEEAGLFDKAKQMYQSVLSVNPNLPAVKEKLKQTDEAILTSNETTIELDAGRGWGASQVRVFKGRPIRIQAAGNYKFVTSVDVGPEGFPTAEPTRDHMAEGVPCGALMAALVEPGGKIGKPFPVGTGKDYTPNEDGLLFFKLNVPPGARCTGKVQVRMSGHVLAN